jgi:hypothetical protein
MSRPTVWLRAGCTARTHTVWLSRAAAVHCTHCADRAALALLQLPTVVTRDVAALELVLL